MNKRQEKKYNDLFERLTFAEPKECGAILKELSRLTFKYSKKKK